MDLAILNLVLGNGVPRAVEDDEAGAGGALVDGAYETILEIVGPIILILDNRTTAIAGLVGIHVNLGKVFLLQVVLDVGHVKGILHFGHDYGENETKLGKNPR